MKTPRCILFFIVILFSLAPEAAAQIGKRIPVKLGYVYPAGGQRGATFEIWVCGRLNVRTFEAVFSGTGISARVVDTQYAFRNLDQRDRWMIRNRVGDAAERLVSETPEGKFMAELIKKLPKVSKPPDPPEEIEAVPFAWPRHARIRKLSEPDVFVPMDEMLEIIYYMYGPPMWRRPPDPLMDIAILEVTIAPDAEPGDRELRLLTPSGLTNPLYFQVGVHPEVMEREPNGPDTHPIANYMLEYPKPVYDTPVVVNGQILHSDVDRFQFRAEKGRQLVLQAQARQLMPFLADAVPGWFEAVVTVYDGTGKELQYADCNRFRPDPLMVFTPPADGVYTAEVRDSLFRGREDFVYRLSIAPTPVVESVFPLGLKEGTSAVLKLEGKNLPVGEVKVDAAPGPDRFREITRLGPQWLPIPIRYEVDTLPEIVETGNNNTRETAQAVPVPGTVNGRIAKPGEYDFYRFDGKEGEAVIVEVTARRLDSMLDSRIALFDASGKQIAENDDGKTVYPDNNYLSDLIGTQTHNADSKLSITLPAGGPFFVRIGDAGRKGGSDYAYRLRISRPRPEFDVFTTPSGLTFFADNAEPIWFYVNRKEGFDAPIELRLVGETHGFQLDGGLVQPGESGVIATLTTPKEPLNKAIPLRFEAVASLNDQTVRRPVHAVEDMEQAFLYHHWVPSSDMWILMVSRRTGTGFRPVDSGRLNPLVLKQGQSVDIEFESQAAWVPPTTIFYPREAPPGVWVRKKSQEGKKLVLTVGANADALQKIAEKEYAAANPPQASVKEPTKEEPPKEETPKPAIEPKKSYLGNLIVLVDAETIPKDPNDKKTRYQTGALPAIPFRLEP